MTKESSKEWKFAQMISRSFPILSRSVSQRAFPNRNGSEKSSSLPKFFSFSSGERNLKVMHYYSKNVRCLFFSLFRSKSKRNLPRTFSPLSPCMEPTNECALGVGIGFSLPRRGKSRIGSSSISVRQRVKPQKCQVGTQIRPFKASNTRASEHSLRGWSRFYCENSLQALTLSARLLLILRSLDELSRPGKGELELFLTQNAGGN